jgi:hypothetical protein
MTPSIPVVEYGTPSSSDPESLQIGTGEENVIPLGYADFSSSESVSTEHGFDAEQTSSAL